MGLSYSSTEIITIPVSHKKMVLYKLRLGI
ncbi:unnamed protein product [Larinioides sclopetarius]|uniref:Uncharacterized protein n=1 Tax=Larinioides sclopetarius TaxID=280406 RepID=A0AAV2BNM1_9ARAC